MQAQVIQAIRVVGQGDSWSVVVSDSISQSARALAATRSQQTRFFKRLEAAMDYLKALGIVPIASPDVQPVR